MSTVRHQSDRHWIQLEYKIAGKNTRAIMIDLNMVDEVLIVRNLGAKTSKPEDIKGVKITYAGTLRPMAFENWDHEGIYAATEFMKAWYEFIDLKHVDKTIGKPTLIELASADDKKFTT